MKAERITDREKEDRAAAMHLAWLEKHGIIGKALSWVDADFNFRMGFKAAIRSTRARRGK